MLPSLSSLVIGALMASEGIPEGVLTQGVRAEGFSAESAPTANVHPRLRLPPALVPAQPLTNFCADQERRIEFLHPGYLRKITILDLNALDIQEGGLHHQTALTACGIVAGNCWDGWLTETREGAHTVDDVIAHTASSTGVRVTWKNPDYPVLKAFTRFPIGVISRS